MHEKSKEMLIMLSIEFNDNGNRQKWKSGSNLQICEYKAFINSTSHNILDRSIVHH